jgi:poly(3-hydroxybutyrate) depolymerase
MTVRYEGGYTPAGAYPGAVETVAAWAAHTGCAGDLAVTGRKLDVDHSVPGEETVEAARSGCPAGTTAALWTIERGGHVPAFNENWAPAIWSFMSTHPKVS